MLFTGVVYQCSFCCCCLPLGWSPCSRALIWWDPEALLICDSNGWNKSLLIILVWTLQINKFNLSIVATVMLIPSIYANEDCQTPQRICLPSIIRLPHWSEKVYVCVCACVRACVCVCVCVCVCMCVFSPDFDFSSTKVEFNIISTCMCVYMYLLHDVQDVKCKYF